MPRRIAALRNNARGPVVMTFGAQKNSGKALAKRSSAAYDDGVRTEGSRVGHPLVTGPCGPNFSITFSDVGTVSF
jgi:hypothetical protein